MLERVRTGRAPGDRLVRRRRGSAMRRQEARDGYLMIAPWFVGFIFIVLGPMIASLLISFTNWQLVVAPVWVGLQNYVTMLTKDALIRVSLENTAFYAFISTPLYAAIGLGMAMALQRRIRGLYFYRTIYFLPSITPVVAATLLWMLIFEPSFGWAAYILQFLHLPPQLWLSDPHESKPVLIVMYLWGAGASLPIFLAGLNAIPNELYEAAAVDGASGWRMFWQITLPLVSPVLFFILVTGFIAGFQIFTPAYVVTGGTGAPDNSTLFFALYLYNNAFQFLKMGYASAMAWLLFVIILGFTFVQFTVARRLVYYETSSDS